MAAEDVSRLSIRNVAVATDFSDQSERAVQQALAIARHFEASLHFLHLARTSDLLVGRSVSARASARDCEEIILSLKSGRELDGVACHRWTGEGGIAQIVGDFVRNEHIDLLVVESRDQERSEPLRMQGSLREEILRHAQCPVLAVMPSTSALPIAPGWTRILFATDLSRSSLAAVPHLQAVAHGAKPQLDVIHVCSARVFSRADLIGDYRRKIGSLLHDDAFASVQCHLAIGKPASLVLDLARKRKSDLIVLGLKPHHGLYGRPVWNQADEIVRRAACPVLSIPFQQPADPVPNPIAPRPAQSAAHPEVHSA